MGFIDNIKEEATKLFSTSPTASNGVTPSASLSTLKAENPDSRQTGETYQHWGLRICGIVGGSLAALPPYLQNVYNYIYREQAENIELQEQARKNTQAEIDKKNTEIEAQNKQVANRKDEIELLKKKIDELKTERSQIKSGREQVNKNQRLKLILGLVILIPLTFYLFLFYSSTFYSAFFRDPNTMSDGVMNAMFDANALSKAFEGGITELGFVISAPVIFLGLGFGLHFFSIQKGGMKYVKMGAIVLVTLMFDCILAFLIGKQLHELGMIIGTVPLGAVYSVSDAIDDINTWAVIFCGFIVYIIWGIVFDMALSAYDKMDLNKTRLEEIEKAILDHENSIRNEKSTIDSTEAEITKMKNEINQLMSKLGHEVYIDYSAIKTEMTNFFSGWIMQMQVLSLPTIAQNQAQQIYNDTIKVLIKE